jgi:hypothetical protein
LDGRAAIQSHGNLNETGKEKPQMPTKYSIDSVLAGIERIARVWVDNPTFTLGEVTLQSLQANIVELRRKRDQVEDLRMQLTGHTNDLNTKTAELAAIRTRALSGLRATYGPNSTQYEQGGGTPSSERRRPSRKGGGSKES